MNKQILKFYKTYMSIQYILSQDSQYLVASKTQFCWNRKQDL